MAVRGWAASWPRNVHFMSLEGWSHAGAGDNFHWLLTEWAAPQLHSSTAPLGVQRWPPQTSSSPGHCWALSLTGDAGTIRDLTDPGQSTKKVQSAWMKVIRAVEERQNQSLHNLYYIVIYSEEVCKMLRQYWYSSSCYLDEDIFSLYVGSDVCRTLHYSIFTGDCCQL